MPNSLHTVAARISLALDSLSGDPAPVIKPFLNGHAAHSIDRMLSRERRRKDGIFFSGESWSQRLLSCVGDTEIVRWCDPAAGTGDLLLQAARLLPLKRTLAQTLRHWSHRLVAGEKNAVFLDVAWQRIRALAVLRHFERDGHLAKLAPSLRPDSFVAGDALATPVGGIRATDCIIMNPPYTHSTTPAWCQTSSGRISTAALFLERYLTDAPSGTRIVALLPDVIRSGTRYRALREHIYNHAAVDIFSPQGAFSADADVDVSILACTVGTSSKNIGSQTTETTVGDRFQVRVGNVVPYRTPRDGPAKRYLTARGLPENGILSSPVSRATFAAPVFRAPFVVVRRTSSPGDRIRTRATLVRDGEYLVENHLIVCTPSQPEVDCESLLRLFADSRTNDWMNERIRCRHLTTAAVNELPIWV